MITYKSKLSQNDYIKLCSLYSETGWLIAPCTPELIEKLVVNSFYFLSAWDGERLVGMGRVISDGQSDGYLQEIYVHIDYRKQGIARNIIRQLIDNCLERGVKWLALIAAPGATEVYKKLGFEVMDGYVPMKLKI